MKIISCGGVIYRVNQGIVEFYLCYHQKYGYVLPKGRVENGENLRQTAEREILEETGFDLKATEFLVTQAYNFIKNEETVEKEVNFFAFPFVEQIQQIIENEENIQIGQWFDITNAKMAHHSEFLTCLKLLKKLCISEENQYEQKIKLIISKYNLINSGIVAITIFGSLARHNFVKGWSDIDLLVFTNTEFGDTLIVLQKIVSEISQSFDIKCDYKLVEYETVRNIYKTNNYESIEYKIICILGQEHKIVFANKKFELPKLNPELMSKSKTLELPVFLTTYFANLDTSTDSKPIFRKIIKNCFFCLQAIYLLQSGKMLYVPEKLLAELKNKNIKLKYKNGEQIYNSVVDIYKNAPNWNLWNCQNNNLQELKNILNQLILEIYEYK